MTFTSAWHGALGGALIGLAASIALLSHGRIAGISGTLGRAIERDDDGGFGFRIAFLAGMIAVGFLAYLASPAAIGAPAAGTPLLVVAGLLVGFGTTLANGCTSGHGVCGLSRGSSRSLVAVGTFMATAAITVAIARAVTA
ncbi:MAG: YeeE/YedE family protein [Proteobacteria bacterium]|nr:YeeE/YedE family protein [Pseudomonadota bacterium]